MLLFISKMPYSKYHLVIQIHWPGESPKHFQTLFSKLILQSGQSLSIKNTLKTMANYKPNLCLLLPPTRMVGSIYFTAIA